jgi:hypothetical protein
VILGVLSDAFAAELGARSIARGLLWMLTLNVTSVIFYLLSARYYRADVERARQPELSAILGADPIA